MFIMVYNDIQSSEIGHYSTPKSSFFFLALPPHPVLNTLCLHHSNNNKESHLPLLHPPDRAYTTSWSNHLNASILLAICAKEICNHQDMVFICPPGISDGDFQLRMDNIWFHKMLLLFKINMDTDTKMQQHQCAFVSVLEEPENKNQDIQKSGPCRQTDIQL